MKLIDELYNPDGIIVAAEFTPETLAAILDIPNDQQLLYAGQNLEQEELYELAGDINYL